MCAISKEQRLLYSQLNLSVIVDIKGGGLNSSETVVSKLFLHDSINLFPQVGLFYDQFLVPYK
jgi:hypothetical protein